MEELLGVGIIGLAVAIMIIKSLSSRGRLEIQLSRIISNPLYA